MRVRLSPGRLIWGLPSWYKTEYLSPLQPEKELGELTERDKEIVDAALKSGDIYNPEQMCIELSPQNIGILPPLEINRRINSVRTVQELKDLEKAEFDTGSPRRSVLQLITKSIRHLSQKEASNPFIADVGINPRWATISKIQDEPGSSANIVELIKQFEEWAGKNNKEKDNKSFQEYVESLNARPNSNS